MNNITCRKLQAARLTFAFVVLLGGAAAPRALAKDVCVAVIAPEVLADLPAGDRKTLAGQLDTLLTESLTRQKGFILVDRQALDKVLAERKVKTAGLTKIAPKDVGATLRPFFASGVLICPTIRKDKQGDLLIGVEAVLAQTGQLLAELRERGVWKSGRWTNPTKVVERMGHFCDDIHRNLKGNIRVPLVEISGKLTSTITRLQWMMDDLGDAASARVALAPNAIPLVPRHPLSTREERLLRVMGLSTAKAGDTAADLRPTPDVRLLMELGETTKTGVSFTKTPIRLKLSLQGRKSRSVSTVINSQAGQWEACRKQALAWIDTSLRALSSDASTTTKPDDDARAKKMAREELASVEQWTKARAWDQGNMGASLRLLVVRKALRAAHLDPTNEQAAYLVVLHVDALYVASGQKETLASYDRAISECERYLDRFGRKVADHHRETLNRLGRMAVCATFKTGSPPVEKRVIFPIPDEMKYHYYRIAVRAWAEYGYLGELHKKYDNSNSFTAFGYNLAHNVIPNCPVKELGAEYEYWKNFWDTKVRAIQKRKSGKFRSPPVPWEFIEATFAARRKDPQAVRAALQSLARVCPQSLTAVWGGDQYKDRIVPIYLKHAGDRQWKSWKPGFRKVESIQISLNEMTGFLRGLWSGSPSPWVFTNLPVVPFTEMVVPERVRKTGRQKGNSRADVDGLLTTGDDIWLVTPATWPGSTRERNWLFAATLTQAKAGKVLLNPVEVRWPKYDLPGKPILKCSRVTKFDGKVTVWLGTKAHGLAQFKKVSGHWIGRWYTTRDGMPMNSISRISACRSGDDKILLLIDQSTRRMFKTKNRSSSGPLTMVWTLNPKTGDVKLLFDGAKGDTSCDCPVGKLSNGRKVFLELLDEGVYPNVDIKDVTVMHQKDGFWFSQGETIPVTRDAGQSKITRVWYPNWDGYQKVNTLYEISPDTLSRIGASSPGRGDRRLSLFPVNASERYSIFGKLYWRSGDYATLVDRWPAGYVSLSAGCKDVLWMTVNWGVTSSNWVRHIVGYRPGPKGSKNWAEKDCWIGPFQLPAHSSINRMVPDGDSGLLLSTSTGVYRMDCDAVVAQAKRSGRVCSTAEWRKEYEKRLGEAGWGSLTPTLIMAKRWDEALGLMDNRQRKLGAVTKASSRKDRDEWIRLQLWRAYVNAKQPDRIAQAIECYDRVAGSSLAGPPAEAFARINQILLLHKAGRWREMLDLCEKVTARFPQTEPRKESDRLNWYINNARKELKKTSNEKK